MTKTLHHLRRDHRISADQGETNPAVPISVDEQVESTQEAFEAGAAIVHAHVRNPDQTPTSDPEKFARLKEGLEKHCPGMIIQFSTGGPVGRGTRKRGGMLPLKPDMASLAVGSNNFPTRGLPETAPIWSTGWRAKCAPMTSCRRSRRSTSATSIKPWSCTATGGCREKTVHPVSCWAFQNAMPVDRDVFDYYIKTVERLAPDAEWCAAGIGRHQLAVNEWCIAAGGHTRTGLEDNVRLDKDTLAPSNAALVKRAADLCAKVRTGRWPAGLRPGRCWTCRCRRPDRGPQDTREMRLIPLAGVDGGRRSRRVRTHLSRNSVGGGTRNEHQEHPVRL